MPTNGQRYNVGGVMLERPFKIRRLGHFGFNLDRMEEGRQFYGDLLGFKVSDIADFSRAPWFPKDFSGSQGYFMRYGTDHHAMVLFSKKVMDQRADRKFVPGISIEQIGWNQLSKPRDMYYRGFNEKPSLPQMSESAELAEAREKGMDVYSGHKPNGHLPETYDVEGVMLARPFKITKIGPVSLFVDDVDAAERFYVERLGFVRSEDAVYRGARCAFLRCGAEHHTLGLFPKELRKTLGLSEHSSCMSFGIELGSYAQLREAVAFLKSRGVEIINTIPPELYPGIDYSAFALDPDGHCIQLYYYMEQIGWDGRVRPAAQRRKAVRPWPEALEPLGDTYQDQVFQGPLG
jgi:catechol 2,3-dioxygenase-like lactoylglutathione lyase family enzyme